MDDDEIIAVYCVLYIFNKYNNQCIDKQSNYMNHPYYQSVYKEI